MKKYLLIFLSVFTLFQPCFAATDPEKKILEAALVVEIQWMNGTIFNLEKDLLLRSNDQNLLETSSFFGAERIFVPKEIHSEATQEGLPPQSPAAKTLNELLKVGEEAGQQFDKTLQFIEESENVFAPRENLEELLNLAVSLESDKQLNQTIEEAQKEAPFEAKQEEVWSNSNRFISTFKRVVKKGPAEVETASTLPAAFISCFLELVKKKKELRRSFQGL